MEFFLGLYYHEIDFKIFLVDLTKKEKNVHILLFWKEIVKPAALNIVELLSYAVKYNAIIVGHQSLYGDDYSLISNLTKNSKSSRVKWKTNNTLSKLFLKNFFW